MIGQKLGSFRIEAELGSGRDGGGLQGDSTRSSKPAAIKIISPSRWARGRRSTGSSARPTILEQFRHPNIVRYMARGKSGGTYYYAMEYITGPTLDKVLRERETLPWREVVALGVQLCEALQYSHERAWSIATSSRPT